MAIRQAPTDNAQKELLNDAQVTIDLLKGQAATKDQLLAESQRTIELLSARIVDFQDRIEKSNLSLVAETKIRGLTRENTELKNQIGSLQSDLQQIARENNELSQENHQLSSGQLQLALSFANEILLGNELVVVTTQSRKFHRDDCFYLAEVAAHYKTIKKKSEAVADGGRPCRTCRP